MIKNETKNIKNDKETKERYIFSKQRQKIIDDLRIM